MFQTGMQLFKFTRQFGIKKLINMIQAHTFAKPILRGYYTTNCLIALFESGCFKKLESEGIDFQNWSDNGSINKFTLKSILDYLYHAGYIEKDGGRYYLRQSTAKKINDSKGPFLFSEAYGPLLYSLKDLLINKAKYGVNVNRIDEKVVEASGITEEWVPYPVVRQLIRKYGFSSILDVGCGSCDFLIKLCKELKGVSCIGVDISDDAITVAKRKIAESNFGDRICLAKGDFLNDHEFTIDGVQPDVITFMFVLHELLGSRDSDAVAAMLKRLSGKFRGSHFLICELGQQPDETLRQSRSLLAEHFFYHELSNQNVLSADKWKEIFKHARLEIQEVIVFDFVGQIFFLLRKSSE